MMKILVKLLSNASNIKTLTLVNSGAGGNFIHLRVVNSNKLSTITLMVPIQAYNINGTPNVFDTKIDFRDYSEDIGFYILGLEKQDLILRYL